MSTLNKTDIKKRLNIEKYGDPKKLVVTPLLDENKQINSPGVDLRLSNHFIVFKSENFSHLDIKDNVSNQNIRRFQQEVLVPIDQPFILHPSTLVLGSTLEYVSMPLDVEGELEGRSSWARLGLIIATACAIDPGFKGCITLELTNLGNQPLLIYPGIRIAKLILRETLSQSSYSDEDRKYFCQIGPEFTKIHTDTDLNLFNKISQ